MYNFLKKTKKSRVINYQQHNLQTIPDMFCCPITFELIIDPVIDAEGNTYEKVAILEWLSINSVSPITREPLSVSDLVPNRIYKTMVQYFYNNRFLQHSKKISNTAKLFETISPFYKFQHKRNTIKKHYANPVIQYYNIREIEQEYQSKFIELEKKLKQEYQQKLTEQQQYFNYKK